MRTLKDYIVIFAKGLCMGATEIVHGVSGSTMAIVFGVYQEFIHSLREIDRVAWKHLRSVNIAAFWNKINGNFLATILAGIIISLFTTVKIVAALQQQYFIITTSFLFGLILTSGVLMLRKVSKWNPGVVLSLFMGAAISYFFTILPIFHSADNYFFVFVAGMLAGISLAFPGISSAFILILIGKYQLIVISFTHLNFGVICTFFIGSVLGLWMASRFIYRILVDYYSTTVALLAGLMLGALNKLWPWRNIFEYVTNARGEQIPAYDKSMLPWKYLSITGKDPQVFQAVLMMALSVFLVVIIEKIAAGLKTKI